MKAREECRSCLAGLVVKAAREGACPAAAEAEALARLDACFALGRSVPTRLATGALRALRDASGVEDPFFSWRMREYEEGCRWAEREAPPPGSGLDALLRFSALGNRMDFFREAAAASAETDALRFALDDSDALLALLVPGKTLLLLADNAGELPFDLPLVDALRRRGLRVIHGVKGQPSQNDLTRDDLARFGVALPDLVDTGDDRVGSELEGAPLPFLEAFRAADVVLAKGMANLETLSEYPEALAKKRVFFLLVAKCAPVAAFLGVDKGTAVLASARRLAGGAA